MPQPNDTYECYNCHDTWPASYLYRYNNHDYCADCCGHCDQCGGICSPTEDYCHECRPTRSEVISEYHGSDPTELGFWRNGKRLTGADFCRNGHLGKTRFFGMELEFEVSEEDSRDRLAQKCLDTFHDRATAEEDGSLSNGFEIITAPMDYGTMHKVIEGLELPQELHCNQSCGLHIHVSRRSLSPLTIGKLLVFVHDYKNSALINHLARRGPSHYCERLAKKLTTRELYGYTRYQAINTVNVNTIEFRFFRSAKTPWRILAALETVQALIEWCEQTSIKELTRASFEAWVAKRQNTYANLVKLLDTNSPISWTRVRSQFPRKVVPPRYRVPVNTNYAMELGTEEAA